MTNIKSTVDVNDTFQVNITAFDDKIAQFRVLWTINDYEGIKYAVKRNEYIETTKSFSVFDNGLRYRLEVFPKGASDSSGTHASVYLQPHGTDIVKTWYCSKFKIMDKTGGIHHAHCSAVVEVDSRGSGWPDCFPIDISSELLSNKSLQIIYEGTMWSEDPEFNEEKRVYDWMEKGSSVMADPKFFFPSSNNLDDAKVTHNNGLNYFSVSKSFLCSRSAVFHKKFSSVSDNNIKLPNVSVEVFHIIAYFLCTNTVLSTISTMLPEVIKFASEFELSYLMEIYQIKMIQNLKEQNALDYFRIAKKVKAEKLKKKSLDFIVANGASISPQPSFRAFKAQYSEIADLLDRLMIGDKPVFNF